MIALTILMNDFIVKVQNLSIKRRIGENMTFPVTFNCVPVTFNCVPVTFYCVPVTFNCVPVTFNCVPVTFNCVPVTFNCVLNVISGFFLHRKKCPGYF